jgi:transposase-like protein
LVAIRRPAPPNRRFSPEARDVLAVRYNDGASTAELAAEYGVSVQRMNAVLLSSPVYSPRRRKRAA